VGTIVPKGDRHFKLGTSNKVIKRAISRPARRRRTMPFGPRVGPGLTTKAPLPFPPNSPQGVRGDAPKQNLSPSISPAGGEVGGRFFLCWQAGFDISALGGSNFHFSPHKGV